MENQEKTHEQLLTELEGVGEIQMESMIECADNGVPFWLIFLALIVGMYSVVKKDYSNEHDR